MTLVTIFKAFDPVEAQLIRSLLESADIPATVAHETAALTTGGGAMTIGGIEVQVPEDQVTAALEIIRARAPGNPPPPAP